MDKAQKYASTNTNTQSSETYRSDSSTCLLKKTMKWRKRGGEYENLQCSVTV